MATFWRDRVRDRRWVVTRVGAPAAAAVASIGIGALSSLTAGDGSAAREPALSASLATLSATVRRSELIDEDETGGIGVYAADPGALEGTMASGSFPTGATAANPTADAASQGRSITVPAAALAANMGAALLIGAVAGLYPAIRAARLSPTEALRSG